MVCQRSPTSRALCIRRPLICQSRRNWKRRASRPLTSSSTSVITTSLAQNFDTHSPSQNFTKATIPILLPTPHQKACRNHHHRVQSSSKHHHPPKPSSGVTKHKTPVKQNGYPRLARKEHQTNQDSHSHPNNNWHAALQGIPHTCYAPARAPHRPNP